MEFRKRSAPQLLAGTILNLLASFDAGDHFGIVRLCRVWPEAVGDAIARRTEVVGLKFKTATIKVTGAMWIQELTLMKPQILDRLRAALGDDVVAEIRFVQGRMSRRERPRLRAIPRAPRRAIELPPVADSELRNALERLVESWGRDTGTCTASSSFSMTPKSFICAASRV